MNGVLERPAPDFADQVAAIDAVETASRIMTRGARAAIGASTVEIVALAQHTLELSTLAALTFDMLAIADALKVETDQIRRAQLGAAVDRQIDDVATALEALGYGSTKTTTIIINPEGQTNG